MSISTKTYSWEPQWTSKVKIESGGRYPLGLNRFHGGLEELLIKGVTEIARRLRYVTYCCWAIGDIERNESCSDYAEFVEAFTRRENALAVGLYLLQPPYGISGSNALSKIVSEEKQRYDCSNIRLMESNDLGAFGLYYQGTTFNWGLTESDEKGIIRLTRAGKELSEIIDRQYGLAPPAYYEEYKGHKNVPAEVLLEWGRVNDLDNIRGSAHLAEREFYRSLLFRLETKQPADYRRDTFAFFLEGIRTCSEADAVFDEDALRNIHYYASYFDQHAKALEFPVPERFRNVHFYWSVYEGHVYFGWWLSRYFEAFLEHLKSRDDGATIDEFFASLDAAEFDRAVAFFTSREGAYFNGSLESIFDLFRSDPELDDSFSEESISSDEEFETAPGILAKFVLVMAGLYNRFAKIRADHRYRFVNSRLEGDLSLECLFWFSNLRQMPTLDFLRQMLRRHVINQHDLIMIEKNDLRRCWFTSENNRYFHQADVSLIWRAAKFETIMYFLKDINLIAEKSASVRLTAEGEAFYSKLLAEYY